MAGYWNTRITGKQSLHVKHTRICLKIQTLHQMHGLYQTFLTKANRPDLWYSIYEITYKSLTLLTMQMLVDQYSQTWHGTLLTSIKGQYSSNVYHRCRFCNWVSLYTKIAQSSTIKPALYSLHPSKTEAMPRTKYTVQETITSQ